MAGNWYKIVLTTMVTNNQLFSFIFLALCVVINAKEDQQEDGTNSSYYCGSPNTSLAKLAPGFNKICPEITQEELGQPICGDGTSFSFSYTSPSQRKANNEKIIIEFQGGGACWDNASCQQAGDRLSYPQDFDNFLGLSCSAAAYGSSNVNGYPINFLCDTTIGDVDLSTYNYILVPYCSQDVHLGDNEVEYEEGTVTYHHGAHNMMSVLKWVYRHFPNPSHILLTGCSAGGSPLPVVYDLMYHHYNSFLKGGRSVNINTLMDSAVYLTPKYFINNGMVNWNVDTILKQTNFDLDQEHSVQYSTRLWEHVLSRGSMKDKWGFISHTSDSVSIAYWQAMGAGYYDDDDQNGDCDSWYSDIAQSFTTVQGTSKNTDIFWIDGDGHCSLGLYYGLQEDGFHEWAGSIIEEKTIMKRTNESVPMFLTSLSIGAALMTLSLYSKSYTANNKSDALLFEGSIERSSPSQRARAFLSPLGSRFQCCPITTFYYAVSSIYFMFTLICGGFTHPLNNPSLGPSATNLSKFGINNPTLIVEKNQVQRIFVAGFMSSGVLTFMMVTVCVFRCMRHTENAYKNSSCFAFASVCIMVGSNLTFACFGNGASCGSLAFALGMNVFSMRLRRNSPLESELRSYRPICTTIFFTILGTIAFPFNSWIMILSAMVIGAIIPSLINVGNSCEGTRNQWKLTTSANSKKTAIVGALFLLMFILILSGVPNPNSLYQYPFLTGCTMMYSTDVGTFINNAGYDFDNLCAQFCVPHLIEKPFYFGLKKYADYSGTEYAVNYGICEDIGYSEHIADQTFSYMAYPLDVEVYDINEND